MAEQTEQNTAAFQKQDEAARQKEREKICTWRRTLHQIPETGLDNPETAAYLKSQLDPAWQILNSQHRAPVSVPGWTTAKKPGWPSAQIRMPCPFTKKPVWNLPAAIPGACMPADTTVI